MVKLAPVEGTQDTSTTSPLLSVAMGVSHFTTAVDCPMSASTVWLVGQTTLGFSVSVNLFKQNTLCYNYVELIGFRNQL